MSESLLNGISGRIGEPEGAFRLLAQPEVQRELENYINQQIVNLSVSTGSGTIIAARVNAAGTIISSSLVASAARQGEGWYRVTISTAAASSDDVKPVVTPATTAGNGGDGVTPLKAFNNYEVEDTDDSLSNFFKDPTSERIVLLGSNIDALWKHDITIGTFPGTATTVDAGTYAVPANSEAGCLSYEGAYIWFSGTADTYRVRAIKLSDSTLTDFSDTPGPGDPATNITMLFADDNSGTPRIWTKEGSTFNRYTPNFGGALMGAADFNYASLSDCSLGALPFVQDNDGYLWGCTGTQLFQMKKTSGSSWFHACHPDIATPGSGSPFGGARNFFDAVNNRLIVVADGHSTGIYSGKRMLWEYKNWANELASSGTWRLLGIIGTTAFSFWYDAYSDVTFVCDYGDGKIRRYIGDPLTLLDEITFVITTGDIPYSNASPYTCWYDGDGYGYVQGNNGAAYYLIRVDYQGDPIGIGTGGSVVSSVLVPQYSVISSSVVDVFLYRTMSPPQRADGEFTIHIDTA